MAWLWAAAAVAGVVRGFAGFGTGMVFLPVAARVLDPVSALVALVVMDLVGPLPAVPRALRDGHPPDIARLGLAMVLAMPLGLYALTQVPPEVFRWGVSLAALTLLAALVSGLRYRGRLTPPLVWATGAAGGVLGGAVGLGGPPVILLYLASTLPPAAVRGTITVYLILTDVALIALLGLMDRLTWAAVATGAALIPVYLLANLAGAAMFRPERARAYRVAAYAIIAGSALSGLPLWS
ncbi:sulfite exporter TauE/SafE family protein [Rhodobacteraceae bacterium CCMM004]|nr:sulfite exporter TauE/SafE family protein [Rhodobacteraceae bacterium CCMM004]